MICVNVAFIMKYSNVIAGRLQSPRAMRQSSDEFGSSSSFEVGIQVGDFVRHGRIHTSVDASFFFNERLL